MRSITQMAVGLMAIACLASGAQAQSLSIPQAEARGRQLFRASRAPVPREAKTAVVAAQAAASEQGFRPCAGSNFKPVAVRNGAGWSVYLITVVPAGQIPFGGHFRFDVDRDGRVTSFRRFTNSCLTVPMPVVPSQGDLPRVEAMAYTTHSLDDTPTEIHVYLATHIRRDLYVATERNNWRITNGRIVKLNFRG